MTDEDIWKTYMACPVDLNVDQADLHKFAKAIAAKEREACAKICQEFLSMDCADAIKARGE